MNRIEAVVIGYGNTLRGDDAAGPIVAEAIAALGLPRVRTLIAPQLTPELAEVLAEAGVAVFVDAAEMPDPERVEVVSVAAAGRSQSLGHTSDPGVLLALAVAVYGRCPPACLVRIPAASFALGAGLSPITRRACAAAVQEIVRLVAGTEDPGDAAPGLGREGMSLK